MSSNFPIFSTLDSIFEPFKGILLDAYGVFWGGHGVGLLPGSREAMKKLISHDKIVGVLSNTSQLAVKEINKYQEHGLLLDHHFHFFITSGELARSFFNQKELPFKTPQKKFWLWGSPHPRFASHHPIFQDSVYQETSHLDEADFIYLSIPHIEGEDQVNREVFRPELEKLRETNLPMICPNPDWFAHEGNPPRAVVRQGSIAAMYEELNGQVFYIGKPYKGAYETAMHYFSQQGIIHPDDILMIGDTPETDIRGARQFGMSTALVTQTGLMADRIATHGLEKAIQTLSLHDTPHFFIERFAYELF